MGWTVCSRHSLVKRVLMELRPLAIAGAMEIVPNLLADKRGFFARAFDADVLLRAGLRSDYVQESVAFNATAGTVRGMHYQAPPAWETKIVSCFAGSVFDVILDLRRNSPTFGNWTAVELSSRRCNSVYIPQGCAHGYQVLEDASLLHYKITPSYVPGLARGIDPLDEALGIRWPRQVVLVSERDRSHPSLRAYTCESL